MLCSNFAQKNCIIMNKAAKAICLFVLGNGFDKYHSIKSGYFDYRDWLKENRHVIYERLSLFYDTPQDDWWRTFEESLSKVRFSNYIRFILSLKPIELHDRIKHSCSKLISHVDKPIDHVYTAEELAELTVFEYGELISDITDSFRDWVQSLEIYIRQDQLLYIENEDTFCITFNYTDTLEQYYGFPKEQVLHIHNYAFRWQDLILGHGNNKDTIKSWLSSECDSLHGQFEKTIMENAIDKLIPLLDSLKKDTERVISNHGNILRSLRNVHTVYILGFSFSPIDEIYIETIADIINPKTSWHVSCHTNADRENATSFFRRHNIIHYDLIEIDDINY